MWNELHVNYGYYTSQGGLWGLYKLLWGVGQRRE